MDLFEYMRSTNMEKDSPLAARMRPRTLDEVVGQEHIIGKDKLLYRAIQADKVSSVIFYGPPGTGKSMLAKAFVGILPDMTYDEIIEATNFHEYVREEGKEVEEWTEILPNKVWDEGGLN